MPDKIASETDQAQRQAQTNGPSAHAVTKSVERSVETPKAKNANRGGKQEQEAPSSFVFLRSLAWMQTWSPVILNFLIVVALIVHGFLFQKQWEAMQTSINETKSTRELEYRAYVGLKSINFTRRADNPAVGDINVTIINSGRTPALRMKTLSSFELRESPIPEDVSYKMPEEPGSLSVLGPSMENTVTVGQFGAQQPPQAQPTASPNTEKGTVGPSKSQVQQSPPTQQVIPPELITRKKLFVYGLLEYDDIFGHHHQTRFSIYNILGTPDWYAGSTYNSFN